MGNSVKESDETNNWSSVQTITVAGADLTMSAITVPSTGYAGGTVTASNTVSAASTGGNAGSFTIYFYLSADTTVTTSDTYVGYRNISSLAAGASSSADTTLTLPTNISGTYYIAAIADVGNSVKESDETNNWSETKAISVN